MNTKHLLIRLVFVIVLMLSEQSYSQIVEFPLKEMINLADNIFIGTVDSITYRKNEKNMPLTVVSFSHVTGAKSKNNCYTIEFGGGPLNDSTIVKVTHTPSFQVGKTYFIFAQDKSSGAANPVIGTLMVIVRDKVTDSLYVMTQSNRFLTGIDSDYFAFSIRQATEIVNGIPKFQNVDDSRRFNGRPQSNNGVLVSDTSILEVEQNKIQKPATLNTIIAYLKTKYGIKFSSVEYHEDVPEIHGNKTTASSSISYCGSHIVSLVMEQLPTSFTPWYGINNNSMWVWNQYMNIYRYSASDGTFGDNDVNEFGGFPSSSTLSSVYGSGFGWGSSTLAQTIFSWSSPCTQIIESDVFINPSTPFTDNLFTMLSGSAYMYMPTVMHELGHTWGLMTNQTETYDYSLPTVMHGGSRTVVEDGNGVHAADAYLMRRAYASQVSASNAIDLGVESYYAPGGPLRNTTTSSTYCYAGSVIGINGITVENLSNSSVSNMNLNFYLSSDPFINSYDYFCGSVYWTTFPAETYNTWSYTAIIPNFIASGYYYVGATITYNTSLSDGFIGNNATFLPQMVYVDGRTSIANINDENSIGIYNSTTEFKYIINNPLNDDGQIDVYNSIGHKVVSASLLDKNFELPPIKGIYVAHVMKHDRTYTIKLIN